MFRTIPATAVLLLLLMITGCSKDFLESYEERILGTWTLEDVDLRGLGGSQDHLPFRSGNFSFEEGGELTYTNQAGAVYQGSWNMDEYIIVEGCNSNDAGGESCSRRNARRLNIMAIDFSSQQARSETFEEIRFTGTNSFKAIIRSDFHHFVFYFKRQ